jgi:hypothetical protein
LYAFLFFSMRATYPAHLILPHLLILMIYFMKSTNHESPQY